MKNGHLIQHAPTQHPTTESLRFAEYELKVIDLGGHEVARKIWGDYFTKVDGVVYLVDSDASERFKESKNELESLLKNFELSDVPFLILANKSDIPTSATEDEVKTKLGL